MTVSYPFSIDHANGRRERFRFTAIGSVFRPNDWTEFLEDEAGVTVYVGIRARRPRFRTMLRHARRAC